jgi:hypothetical protein
MLAPDERRQGIGSQVMQAIVDEADRVGASLVLTPSTDMGATSIGRLAKFYKRFGFEANYGRRRDYTTQATMIRLPQPREDPEDWSRLASERLGAPGGHVDRVEGRDLLGELTEADWEALAGATPSLYAVASGTAGPEGDRALGQIWGRQGFGGPPRVVDEATLQRAIDSGAMSLWRAVNEVDLGLTTYQTAEQVAEHYRTGVARPGLGGAGNGTYFAPDRARDNMGYYGDAVIHAALSPTARTISLADLRDLMEADGITSEVLFGDDSQWTPRERVLADAGRYAALRGYDAILHWWSARDKEQPHEIIVLNRTALMIAEAADG